MMGSRAACSRKGLSPLLAIIIGLVVTIVAGILLAQLYFSYAATLSARPAVNLEYVDAIDVDNNDVLAINLKNVGNVPIDTNHVQIQINNNLEACTAPDISGSGGPGSVISVTCTDNFGGPGNVVSGSITVSFTDGSNQTIAFSVRIRRG